MLLALGLWQAGSMMLGQKLLLVSPVEVLRRLGTLWKEPGFWQTIRFSFAHIVLGFFLALLSGFLLALFSGRFHTVEVLLWPYVTAMKTVPVASFIILCLIWLSAKELSTFISFLMVFPIVYTNVLQGFKSVDPNLLGMASVFKIGWGRKMLYLYLPHIRPFLLSACSVGFGLSWKAGIAAELIGIPSGSVGEMLYDAKVYWDTGGLFAWTVVVILISVLCEKLFLMLLKKGFDRLETI